MFVCPACRHRARGVVPMRNDVALLRDGLVSVQRCKIVPHVGRGEHQRIGFAQDLALKIAASGRHQRDLPFIGTTRPWV